MIGELRLKVDGMQKELHTQNKRLEEGARFAEHFYNDLRVAAQVLGQMTSSTAVYYNDHMNGILVHVVYTLDERRRSSTGMATTPTIYAFYRNICK